MSGIQFGEFNVSPSEVFYTSQYSLGLVNLKPIADGHVLVMPKRVVLRYSDLTLVEITDLTNAASRISKVLEQVYPHMRNGFIWLIQDGKEAGQTVPHVHLHIIPKRFSEWSQHGIEDVNRVPRTLHDMKLEAKHLESMLRQNI